MKSEAELMSESGTEKAFFGPMKRKVIAAFVLACLAIGFALVITYFSFSGLLDTVDQLSTPNDKLRTLNNLFQEVTRLDQKQRVDAIQNPNKAYREFISESKRIVFIIDTLRAMEWQNQKQIDRLSGIEEILRRRNGLLLSYLRLKSDFVYNKKFSNQLDSLTAILSQTSLGADSSVTTTEKKTTTTTYVPQVQDDRTFLGKLFGKKKKEDPADTRIEVKEELSVKVDTLAIAQQDSAIKQVGRIMRSLEEDQRVQNKKMIQRELELMNTNTVLINQMLATLHEVEGEELQLINVNNERAAVLVNDAVRKIAIVMVIFFLVAALLVFLTLTDITRSNYYRKQLIEARDQAEELGVVKQRFLANMSHEIRTPLQSILGFAEQIRKHDSSNREAVEAIQASSEHLLHIVNEVLDFSRLESGKVVLEYEPFDLLEVVKEVEENIRVQATKKNLSFRVDSSGAQKDMLMGDAFRLRQVLYNLLGNAIKFTNSGEVKLVVTKSEDESGTARCIFEVIDTGIGMNRDDVDRVFQQFEQANVGVTRQYGGTGLGLSIVKKIVEAQNGTITVDSEVGNGSVFTVELYFDHAPAAALKTSITTPAPREKFSGKAMVVDDDPLILRLCAIIFEKNSIPFLTVNEAEKVLEKELDSDIRLILLDIRMPHVNGVELCQGLRARYGSKIRIIALTAHVLEDERDDLLAHGFDQVLSKPFREQELLSVLGVMSVQDDVDRSEDNRLDLSALRRLTMNDEALLQSVLEQFVEETHQDVHALETNVMELDAKAVRELVHKLSGRIGQLGVQGLSKRLRQIEEELDAGKSLSSLLERIYAAQDDVKLLLTEAHEHTVKRTV